MLARHSRAASARTENRARDHAAHPQVERPRRQRDRSRRRPVALVRRRRRADPRRVHRRHRRDPSCPGSGRPIGRSGTRRRDAPGALAVASRLKQLRACERIASRRRRGTTWPRRSGRWRPRWNARFSRVPGLRPAARVSRAASPREVWAFLACRAEGPCGAALLRGLPSQFPNDQRAYGDFQTAGMLARGDRDAMPASVAPTTTSSPHAAVWSRACIAVGLVCAEPP